MKKEELLKELRKQLDKVALQKETPNRLAEYCLDNYNIPISVSMDLITDRVALSQEKDEVIYCLTEALNKVCRKDLVSKYYTSKDQESYENFTYHKSKVSFPIIIPAIDIDEERQWIGKVSAKQLIEWKSLGLIRYNIEKQRVRKKIVRGDDVSYKIDVKEKSVNQISKLMDNNEFIPNTITLDLPEDDENLNFHYDYDKRELIIDKLDHFDITDGFHRLLGMERSAMKNPGFDYRMELRITFFPIYRTQSFIFQEDQTNKMTATNSNSMNKGRASNVVVDRLNEMGNNCNICGQIKRSGGILDYAALSDLVEYFFFNGYYGKEYNFKDIGEVVPKVTSLINAFVDAEPEYYEQYINYRMLSTYFYMVLTKGIDPKFAAKKVVKAQKQGILDKITLRKVRKSLFDQIEGLEIF